MKVLRSFFIMAIFTLVFCSSAAAQDYIFKVSEDAVMPMSMDEDHRHLGRAYYTGSDEEELQRLLEAGLIEYYVPDATVYLMDTATDTMYTYQRDYEFKITNANSVVNNGTYDGRGVRVGIIDTGLVADHPDIDYERVAARRNVADKTDDVTDYQGHGTSVAGIIAAATNNGKGVSSLAPGVDLVIIKAFAGSSATTSVSALIEGLNFAINAECDVINMSVGVISDSNTAGAIDAMEGLINEASEMGIIVVAASGNHTATIPNNPAADSPMMYPAACRNTISVASVDSNGFYSDFSFHNGAVDIAACGGSIRVLDHKNPGGSKVGSGTSFSSPYVAAVAALAKQIKPDITIDEFRALAASTAKDAGEPGWDTHYGYGIINVGKLMDTMLGASFTVSGIYFIPDSPNVSVTIANNGFDNHEIMDIWYREDAEGTRVSGHTRLRNLNVPARSSVETSYMGWMTVGHMVWLRDNLEPLCPAEKVDTEADTY